MKYKEIIKSYLEELQINFEIKTLDDITKLIQAHLRTFSFSSLKVLLKEEISIDLNSIYQDIVVDKRGGYCFEHNKLMYEVLKELGFNVSYYLARVVNNTDNIPPQTHRFTLLNLNNERYIVDVGIGFRSPSVPVKFGGDTSITHLGIEYKVLELEDNIFAMQLIQKGKPFIATKFDLNRCYESDFEMGHFYSYKHPKAVFENNLVVSSIKNDTIHSIVNNLYMIITKDNIQEIEIKDIKQFKQILTDDLNSNFTPKEIELIYNKHIKTTK